VGKRLNKIWDWLFVV